MKKTNSLYQAISSKKGSNVKNYTRSISVDKKEATGCSYPLLLWITAWSSLLLESLRDGVYSNPRGHAEALASIKEAFFIQEGLCPDSSRDNPKDADLTLAEASRSATEVLSVSCGCDQIVLLFDSEFVNFADTLPESFFGRALLVWESPVAAIASAGWHLNEDHVGDFDAIMEDWRQYHQKLLELFRFRSDQVLLLRADRLADVESEGLRAALEDLCARTLPANLVAALQSRVLVRSDWAPVVKYLDKDAWLALLADGYPDCYDLFMELEAVSELFGREPELKFSYPAPEALSRGIISLGYELHRVQEQFKGELEQSRAALKQANQAWEQQARLAQEREQQLKAKEQQLAELSQQGEALKGQVATLTGERDQLRGELEQSRAALAQANQGREEQAGLAQKYRKELEGLKKQLSDLLRQRDSLKSDLDARSQQLKEVTEESELLLTQLHQVQEELERYFLDYQHAVQLLERFKSSQLQTQVLVTSLLERVGSQAFDLDFLL